MSYRSHNTDANQSALFRIAEQYGACVVDTSRVGFGFPDLTLGWRGHTLLVEVKAPEVRDTANEYTPAQKLFRERWRGGALVTVYDEADMHALLGTLMNNAPRSGVRQSVKG